MHLRDPKYQYKVGNPPSWMFDVLDSQIQNRPIEEIRRQPLITRQRYRAVHDLQREAKMALGKNAQAVIDLASL